MDRARSRETSAALTRRRSGGGGSRARRRAAARSTCSRGLRRGDDRVVAAGRAPRAARRRRLDRRRVGGRPLRQRRVSGVVHAYEACHAPNRTPGSDTSPVKNRLGAPTTEEMEDRRPSRDAAAFRRARSSSGSTSSRWPSWPRAPGRCSPTATRRTPTPHLPWWAVALGFAFAEICVVHVRFRRSAHSFSLADLPFVFGLVFASGDEFVHRRARRHRHRLGPDPPAGARQAPLQPRPARARRQARRRRCCSLVAGGADALQPATWVGLYAATLSSGALTILLLGGAIAIAEGNVAPADARPDVRHRRAGHADQRVDRDRRRARRRHRPARRPGAARPGAHRLRRLPRLHLRAPAPRAAGVPLRREPHAQPLAGGRRGARGAARPLAGGLQRRRRRGPALHRRGRAAAHHPRPGRPPRDDGGRPTARSPRSSPAWSTPRTRSSGSPRPSAPRTCAPTCSRAASATR